jgi:hypothetical protein
MGINREIILLPERHITLGTSQVIIQSEFEAQDVSMFVEIVPVLRVKLSSMCPPIPGVGGTAGSIVSPGVTVNLLGSSHVAYRDESVLAGSRWVQLADAFPAVLAFGVTVGTGVAGALAKLAANPGLIACKISNGGGGAVSLVIEVVLVCRGY